MTSSISPTRSVFPSLSITLPSEYHCTSNCAWGRLLSLSSMDVRVGERLHIDIKVIGVAGIVVKDRKYFKWHLWDEEHSFTEIISTNRLQLLIENATSDILGTVFVVCWHCQQPLHTKLEIRIPSSLRATLEELDDSEVLVISGYPLEDLNLTISKADGAEITEETYPLQDRESTKYWNSLIVRPDPGHSQFHRRIFSVFTLGCSACPVDHLAGNFTFTVCSPIDCYSVHNYIDHLGNQSQVNAHEIILPSKHSVLFWVYTLSLTGTVLMTLSTLLILRLRLVQRCHSKMNIYIYMKLEIFFLLINVFIPYFAEERSSLSSSDYSGQIIPFIQMGNIKIHERIGKIVKGVDTKYFFPFLTLMDLTNHEMVSYAMAESIPIPYM
uniref:GPS domain-containing protein n=1 Tax=Heterorhabditis bacteriophora TaxID=37862 RepID=A0A1I7WSB6_HETBA